MLDTKKRTKLYLASTGLYSIPQDWFSEKLGLIIEDLQSGFASGLRDDNGIVQLRMNNIRSDGGFDFEQLLKVPVPPDIENYRLHKDDVVFNNTNSLDLIGKTAIVNETDYTFSNHLTRIRVKKNIILPYWLYFIFLRYRERYVFKAICNTHVGQSGIGKKELGNLDIFFPPLVEQQKIASILSKVDELIQKTDQVIEQTQRLKKGLMQRLLTKGIRHTNFKRIQFYNDEILIPESWSIVKLRDNVRKIGSGITPTGGSKIYGKEGIPLIRSQNVHFDGLKLDDVAYISQNIHEEMKNTKLQNGDVLLNITGASIGRCTLVPFGFGEGNVNQHVCIIRTAEKLNPTFLSFFLSSSLGQKMILRSPNGLSREGLNFKEIGSFLILFPPIEEQQKIANIISLVNMKIKREQGSKFVIQNLKKGLMQKLLTGKIRVKV